MTMRKGVKLDFRDVLLVPQKSTVPSRKNVKLERFFDFKKVPWSGVPIFTSNMVGVGTIEMAKALKGKAVTALHKFVDFNRVEAELKGHEDWICLSSGISLNEVNELIENATRYNPAFVMLDIANGYLDELVARISFLRTSLKSTRCLIIAGNVVEARGAKALFEAGADIVKVGIGNGSACTTRIMTGVGYPQFSAIRECAAVAQRMKRHIISDGGCVCPGDIVKALAASNGFVMIGGMFAGHKESEIDPITVEGKQYIPFYGMSSKKAMEEHMGGMANYRSPEGKEVLIPYRGNIIDTYNHIAGGIRSACTYLGVNRLDLLHANAEFIQVNQQSNEVFGKNT